MAEKEDIKIDGYESRPMNRDEHGGGVMVLVKEELDNIVVDVEKQNEVGETMWMTLTNGRNDIRLGVIYAPQESKTNVAQLKVMYKGLTKQIEEARKRKQHVVMVGDFNCKVGDAVEGNKEEVSKGGKMLLNLANKQNMKIVNSSKKCKGVWTRTDGTKKSVLDYILINKEDEEMVKQMIIDEDREITPYHKDGGRTIFTDHYTVKLEVNWNMRYKPGENKRTVISVKNNQEFERKTSATNLRDIWKTTANLQEKYSEWSQKVVEIANSTYTQKKKNKQEPKAVRLLRRKKKEINRVFTSATQEEKTILVKRRKLINEHIEEHFKEENKQRTFNIARNIKSEKGFDGNAFWEFKRRNTRRKKEEITVIRNEDGEIEEDPEKIREVYQKFYQELLTGKEMTTVAGKQVEKIVDQYIEQIVRLADVEKMEPFSEEEYKTMKKELKARKAPDSQGWRY